MKKYFENNHTVYLYVYILRGPDSRSKIFTLNSLLSLFSIKA
jgi:hypothetical protein